MKPADVLNLLPRYLVRAARINNIIPSDRPKQYNETAQYEHITRNIYVVPNLPAEVMRRSMIHEIAHALDDNFGVGHYFGESPAWAELSRRMYGDVSVVETFAENMATHLLDPTFSRMVNPSVAKFMDEALTYLQIMFKGKTQ